MEENVEISKLRGKLAFGEELTFLLFIEELYIILNVIKSSEISYAQKHRKRI